MEQLLVVSALGHDRPGIVNDLSRVILDASGNIIDSRMTVLGGEFAVILLVAVSEPLLASLEKSLEELGKAKDLTISSRPTRTQDGTANRMPYHIEVVAIDHPGIVYQLTNYLSKHNINIQDLVTQRYAAPHTGTSMFSVDIRVAIPSNLAVKQFREEFRNYCDELNLDMTLESVK